jgi:hypothetical protein
MIPDDVRPVVQQLLDRSRKREVEWLPSSVTAHRRGDFIVLFPSSTFVLWQDENEDRIEASILNSRGDTALSFWASYRDDLRSDYDLLNELFELARRRVLGADESIADIRDALASPGRIGEAPKPRSRPVEDDEEVPF